MIRVSEVRMATDSPDATRQIAAGIATVARRGDVILLSGEMGSGKTVFVQGFGRAVGVDEPITSPTFTLVHTYSTGRLPLHHADLYRLDLLSEVADLALGELAEGDGILVVEWGAPAADFVGDHLEVVIERSPTDDDQRILTVRAVGSAWETRWRTLVSALAPWQVAA
ncbi:MAG: tRNA (adenosine(37)-N6)-threonylcarbamoyltransferase complex ATPase subunit type 1 TsaE [Actinomycetota bacterium]